MSDETEGSDPIDSMLAHVPVGIISISSGKEILTTNNAAATGFGCRIGELLTEMIQPDSLDAFDHLIKQYQTPFELRLTRALGTKVVEAISLPPEGDRQILFFSDISEKVALSRQLRSSRQPSRKTMSQLHAANTTMLGYAELIEVMLDEEPVVAGDRLTVVKRYHKEIRKSLDSIDRLLKTERLGGRRTDASVPLNRKHVVVVDDELAITEYVAELMRGMQHKVSAFSDAKDAMSFCKENADVIDLLITDLNMPIHSGTDLADILHKLRAEVPVVLCSENDLVEIAEDSQLYYCQKPIDINDLTRMVSELI